MTPDKLQFTSEDGVTDWDAYEVALEKYEKSREYNPDDKIALQDALDSD